MLKLEFVLDLFELVNWSEFWKDWNFIHSIFRMTRWWVTIITVRILLLICPRLRYREAQIRQQMAMGIQKTVRVRWERTLLLIILFENIFRSPLISGKYFFRIKHVVIFLSACGGEKYIRYLYIISRIAKKFPWELLSSNDRGCPNTPIVLPQTSSSSRNTKYPQHPRTFSGNTWIPPSEFRGQSNRKF